MFLIKKSYEKAVSETAIIPIKNKRETFRILKDNLESQKNLSESLKFKAIEKEVLRNELKNHNNINANQSLPSKFKSFINNRLERFNLWLNKWSNDHGNSYGRALIFILFVGLAIFYSSLLSTKLYSFTIYYEDWEFKEGLRLFIEFLNPLHKSDYIGKNENLLTRFYLIDFLGKIIIGYGLYQFVQAFRKYK